GEALLAPTRIYVASILEVLKTIPMHALAHITGGGLLENIPRVLPENTRAILDKQSCQLPPVFDWLQKNGNVEINEMYRTFNCGIGMAIIVAEEDAGNIISAFNAAGEKAWRLGEIVQSSGKADVIFK
ncbi:MAG: AIR synthase-related protein, partial [Gammaproteobacteria bacterium]|nr:AIR synthase-related protein [Gammaproteobacteria bacterium]